MQQKIDISFHVHNPLWKTRLRPYCKTVREILELSAATVKLKGGHEVAIVFADDAFVKNLNSQYRGKNKPTNVLSFPSSPITDHRPLTPELGDIILALETIECEAREQHKTFRHHTAHLLVHGFLHLLGHDHNNDAEAGIMEGLETKILKKLGVNNPYL